MSYEELLALEQNIDHLLEFTERDVKSREIEFYWQGKRPGGGGGLPYEIDGDARRLA